MGQPVHATFLYRNRLICKTIDYRNPYSHFWSGFIDIFNISGRIQKGNVPQCGTNLAGVSLSFHKNSYVCKMKKKEKRR